jgi:aminoglycoside phosphotransferase (APT) family kinase protein
VTGVLLSLPDGDRLCHGDFHPDNVIATVRGPVIVDWSNATAGNPLADVARSVLLARFGQLPDAPGLGRALVRALGRLFARFYLRRYCALKGVGRADIEPWLTVVAAARLAERIPLEHEALHAFIRRRFHREPSHR